MCGDEKAQFVLFFAVCSWKYSAGGRDCYGGVKKQVSLLFNKSSKCESITLCALPAVSTHVTFKQCQTVMYQFHSLSRKTIGLSLLL